MKKFIVGLLVGVGISFAFGANAQVVSLVGQTIVGQFPVKIDGKTIESPGIVVDGTSYLPVRKFAEMLGYDVSFNADMGVELKKKPNYVVVPTPKPEIPIEQKIQILQEKIDRQELMLKMNRGFLEETTGEGKIKLQKEIEKIEKFVEDMKAQKAELEAQLQAP